MGGAPGAPAQDPVELEHRPGPGAATIHPLNMMGIPTVGATLTSKHASLIMWTTLVGTLKCCILLSN